MMGELFVVIAISVFTGRASARVASVLEARFSLTRSRWAKSESKTRRGLTFINSGWLMDLMPRRLQANAKGWVGQRILISFGSFLVCVMWLGVGLQGLLIGSVVAFGLQNLPKYRFEAQKNSKRMELARALPDFVDMLAIGVEAGLSLDRAIKLYCSKFENQVAKVFSEAMIEIELGKPRRHAFLDIAAKNNVEQLERFVVSLSQAEKLGSPLAQTLREQAKAGRNSQRQLVRELSSTAPVKMLFPIAGLILPSLLIVVVGPAFLQFAGT